MQELRHFWVCCGVHSTQFLWWDFNNAGSIRSRGVTSRKQRPHSPSRREVAAPGPPPSPFHPRSIFPNHPPVYVLSSQGLGTRASSGTRGREKERERGTGGWVRGGGGELKEQRRNLNRTPFYESPLLRTRLLMRSPPPSFMCLARWGSLPWLVSGFR